MRAENQIQYHNAPPNERSEAAKNIQIRIMDMLNDQKLSHLYKENNAVGMDSPLSPYSPVSPAYSPISPVSETATKLHPHGVYSAENDPYVPLGGNDTAVLSNMQRQQQIGDTVNVIKEQINRISQRGERLDSLQDKTDDLAVPTLGFRHGANRVRKPLLWSPLVKAIQAAQELGSSVYESGSTLFANQEGYQSEDGAAVPQDTENMIEDFLHSPRPTDLPENSEQVPTSSFVSGNIESNIKIESISAHSDERQGLITEDRANQKMP